MNKKFFMGAIASVYLLSHVHRNNALIKTTLYMTLIIFFLKAMRFIQQIARKDARTMRFENPPNTLQEFIQQLFLRSKKKTSLQTISQIQGQFSRTISLALFFRRVVFLASFLEKNYSASTRMFLICNDSLHFASLDVCCIVLRWKLTAIPEEAHPYLIQQIVSHIENPLIVCTSHAAQRFLPHIVFRCRILIVGEKAPNEELSVFLSSQFCISRITDDFRTSPECEEIKFSPPQENEAEAIYTYVSEFENKGEEMETRSILRTDLLFSILKIQTFLRKGDRAGAIWTQRFPLAYVQQRVLFYTMLSHGMDVVLLSGKVDFNHSMLKRIRPQIYSVPLDAALSLYFQLVIIPEIPTSCKLFPSVWKKRNFCLKSIRSYTRKKCAEWFNFSIYLFIQGHTPVPLNMLAAIDAGCGFSCIPFGSMVNMRRKLTFSKGKTQTTMDNPNHGRDWNDSEVYDMPEELSMQTSYLESIYRLSRLVEEIFVTHSPAKKTISVIYPNRVELEKEMNVSSPAEWHLIQTKGKELILADLEKIHQLFCLPKECEIQNALLVAYNFSEHRIFRDIFGDFNRQNVARYYAMALATASGELDDSLGNVELSIAANPDITKAQSFRFPCSIDIGGTCCKIVFFEMTHSTNFPSFCVFERLSITCDMQEGGPMASWPLRIKPSLQATRKRCVMRLMYFPTDKIPQFVDFFSKEQSLVDFVRCNIGIIPATGGGAIRYESFISRKLGVKFHVNSEFESAVLGLNFLLQTVPNEIVQFDLESNSVRPIEEGGSSWPYLLVNVGSGVSILQCNSPARGDHRRISGSALGGGTFWGLCKLLTNASTWEEINEITRVDGPGDPNNVDLLVRDIYGSHAMLPNGLQPDTLASSFGKVSRPSLGFAPKACDYVRSLLILMSNNITQLSFLWSEMLGVRNIYFCGGFLQNNSLVMRHIVEAMDFWSQTNPITAKFVRHNGYLGAIGGLLVSDTSA